MEDQDQVVDTKVDLVDHQDITEVDLDQAVDHLAEVLEDIQDKEHIEIKQRKHQRAINGVFYISNNVNLANQSQNTIVYGTFIFLLQILMKQS